MLVLEIGSYEILSKIVLEGFPSVEMVLRPRVGKLMRIGASRSSIFLILLLMK